MLSLLQLEPQCGYTLTAALQADGFATYDRPSVYRALACLHADGLIEAVDVDPAARRRKRYQVTVVGESVLADWMGKIAREHELLGLALSRYGP